MAGDADPTTDTDLEQLDAARGAELAAVSPRDADDTSEHPAGEVVAAVRDSSEESSGPAVRKQPG
jgi:hypothetical protein